MTANTVIRTIMANKHITQFEFARMLGEKTQSTVSLSLSRNMKSNTLVTYLNALGYDLVVREQSTGTEYIIDELHEKR